MFPCLEIELDFYLILYIGIMYQIVCVLKYLFMDVCGCLIYFYRFYNFQNFRFRTIIRRCSSNDKTFQCFLIHMNNNILIYIDVSTTCYCTFHLSRNLFKYFSMNIYIFYSKSLHRLGQQIMHMFHRFF